MWDSTVTLCRPCSLSPSVGERADGTDAEENEGAGFGDGRGNRILEVVAKRRRDFGKGTCCQVQRPKVRVTIRSPPCANRAKSTDSGY
jgi:hypothetical protein